VRGQAKETKIMSKILIVEDNEMNRDMLSRRLTRKGYEIEMAVDGQEGLDKMRSWSPDVVLMDMGLPVLDGWEATSQAKADAELSSIPIIALTAHAMEADRQKALAAGADDFDTKPVNLSGLLEKIENQLNG
jgi:two-component system cell cycle response regulator DivK|tara:strand:+ start:1236 stop:1631 length:396 start_codon:yes stop_codon:yes gene_type:complete